MDELECALLSLFGLLLIIVHKQRSRVFVLFGDNALVVRSVRLLEIHGSGLFVSGHWLALITECVEKGASVRGLARAQERYAKIGFYATQSARHHWVCFI